MSAAFFVLLLFVATSLSFAENGSTEQAFQRIPLDKWVAAGEKPQIPWSFRVDVRGLSVHQRLMAALHIEVDGNEVAKRRGHGELLFVMRFTDGAGQVYRAHETIDLKNVPPAAGAQMFTVTLWAFVLPGDYRVALAMLDTASEEHSAAQLHLHVAPLKNDPLPDAWQKIPAVEFVDPGDGPDTWFLPSVKGRLHLPVPTRRPVRVHVLANLPAGRLSGNLALYGMNMRLLIGALKDISQMQVSAGSMDVAVLDPDRRRVIFQQKEGGDLNWNRLRAALTEASPGTIDVGSLQHETGNAEFLLTEFNRRLATGESAPAADSAPRSGNGDPPESDSCAVIVLSNPVAFEKHQQLPEVHNSAKQACELFYIRYDLLGAMPPPFRGRRRSIGERGPAFPRPSNAPYADDNGAAATTHEGSTGVDDAIGRALKPAKPKTLHVKTPIEFRKALAELMNDLARM